PEDTQHLKKENALWKYHTITQTLVKSECIPGTYDTMQVLQRNRSFVILGSNASSGPNRLYSLQGDIVPLEKGLGLVNILVIIGYFAVLAGIGI
ncbi:UNVERIFIED_CONTAM: sodium:solute symporter, partial [Bacteroidetes bacterium 56_B9]